MELPVEVTSTQTFPSERGYNISAWAGAAVMIATTAVNLVLWRTSTKLRTT